LSLRLSDRNFSLDCKKDPQDDDDDRVNTKKLIQEDLHALYLGKEFEGEKNYSRMVSTLYVILLYSSGMPILYLCGLMFYFLTHYVNKMLLLKYYRTASKVQIQLSKKSVSVMKYAIYIHIIMTTAMLTNTEPFWT